MKTNTPEQTATQHAAHTPTPWKAARSHEDFDGPLYEMEADDKIPPFKRIYGSNGFAAIACHDLATISDADAALIVEAVNSHANMVAALEYVEASLNVLLLSRQLDSTTTSFLTVRKCRDEAAKALAQSNA